MCISSVVRAVFHTANAATSKPVWRSASGKPVHPMHITVSAPTMGTLRCSAPQSFAAQRSGRFIVHHQAVSQLGVGSVQKPRQTHVRECAIRSDRVGHPPLVVELRRVP